MKSFILIILFLNIALFNSIIANETLQSDNLFLKGIIIAKSKKQVTVKVTSNICNGIRNFKVAKESILRKLDEKQFIGFIINTSYCENNKIYTILEVIKQ